MAWSPMCVYLSGNILLYLCLLFLTTVCLGFLGFLGKCHLRAIWSVRIFLGLPFYHLQRTGDYIGMGEKQAFLTFLSGVLALHGVLVNTVNRCWAASEQWLSHHPLLGHLQEG